MESRFATVGAGATHAKSGGRGGASAGVRRAVIAGGCVMATLLAPALAWAQDLSVEVRRTVGALRLGKAHVGISVYDTSTGDPLASFNADDKFAPASNMKLLTSGAAMLTLGADFSFRTELLREGDRLILKGSGDPALGDAVVLERSEPKMTVEDVLGMMVNAAKKAGMTRVGEIIVDDRVFDREYTNSTWAARHLNKSYGAQVSGLNFHANVLSIYTQPNPQGLGTPPLLRLEPNADWLPMTVKAQTVREQKNTAWASRDSEANGFTVFGDIGVTSQAPADLVLNNAPVFVGELLSHRVAAAGLAASPPPARLAGPDERLPAARTVGVITTPIQEVLTRCNTDSENLYAEALMKRMGHAVTKEPGSWENGASVLRMLLSQRIGPKAAADTAIADGSGLSDQNRVTPETLTRWLGVVADSKGGSDFVASLAQPGKPGTLHHRFKDARLKNELRGKSGFINGVRCLSGYLTHPQTGRRVTFSILVNDINTREETEDAMKLHEQVVRLADEWLAKNPGVAAEKRGG